MTEVLELAIVAWIVVVFLVFCGVAFLGVLALMFLALFGGSKPKQKGSGND